MIGGQLSNNATISNIVSKIIDYINENKFSSTTIKETINNLNIPFLDMFKPYLLNIASDIQHYVINNIDNMTSFYARCHEILLITPVAMVITS